MLVALLHFLLELAFLVEELLLDLKQFLFLDYFGFLVGRLHHLVVFPLDDLEENEISAGEAYS